METIKTTQDRIADLTTITARGKITATTLMKWISGYYAGTVTNFHLWDFTEADLSEITLEESRQILVTIKAKNHSRPDSKSALVFSSDLMLGLGKNFESYSNIDNAPVYFRSFLDMEEAKKWLGV